MNVHDILRRSNLIDALEKSRTFELDDTTCSTTPTSVTHASLDLCISGLGTSLKYTLSGTHINDHNQSLLDASVKCVCFLSSCVYSSPDWHDVT